jgi:hypothetical protein
VPENATALMPRRSVSLQMREKVEWAVDDDVGGAKGGVLEAFDAKSPAHKTGSCTRVLGRAKVDD